MITEISAADFKKRYLADPSKFELVDLREPYEFSQVRIKGSKLIPMGSLVSRLGDIDWDREVIFICRSGARSGQVTAALNDAGYGGKNLAG